MYMYVHMLVYSSQIKGYKLSSKSRRVQLLIVVTCFLGQSFEAQFQIAYGYIGSIINYQILKS